MIDANITAFLAMIAHSEGCDLAPDQYRVCYGYRHTIVDLTYHPAEKRSDGSIEWGGERLPDQMCINAGLSPGCVSTAAGRYQITKPTWLRLKGILNLSNFRPGSQDAACQQLIRERCAIDFVSDGRVADAISLCHTIWASLPGSASGQPKKSIAQLLAAYSQYGGSLA